MSKQVKKKAFNLQSFSGKQIKKDSLIKIKGGDGDDTPPSIVHEDIIDH